MGAGFGVAWRGGGVVCGVVLFMGQPHRRHYCAGGRCMGAGFGVAWRGLLASVRRQMSYRIAPGYPASAPPAPAPRASYP